MTNLQLCLWFDGQAKEAADYYVATFRERGREASIGSVVQWGKVGPGQEGKVVSVEYELDGMPILNLNGGPMYALSPAASLMVYCDDQVEIDHFWDRLTDGGKPSRCGWLSDRFGVAWQILPRKLGEMMRSSDAATRDRVMAAFMPMSKLDLATIERAYEGE